MIAREEEEEEEASIENNLKRLIIRSILVLRSVGTREEALARGYPQST